MDDGCWMLVAVGRVAEVARVELKGWVSLVFFRAMAESVVRLSNNNKGAHVIHHHHHHHHYISRMSPAC